MEGGGVKWVGADRRLGKSGTQMKRRGCEKTRRESKKEKMDR